MFERPHHQRIAQVLQALDAPLLARHGCLFGGGTAMALRYGEYRESVDIDFLVSQREGYRELRGLLTRAEGIQGLAKPGAKLEQARELRADQYGLRTLLSVDGSLIKFEIVLEARIALETPAVADEVCGIATLTALDMACSKLLANSDRWADDGVFSRDLIDLAMMQPPTALLRQAQAKAAQAYGPGAAADLAKAATRLLERDGRLDRCMQALGMSVPKALLWQRIRAFAAKSPDNPRP